MQEKYTDNWKKEKEKESSNHWVIASKAKPYLTWWSLNSYSGLDTAASAVQNTPTAHQYYTNIVS